MSFTVEGLRKSLVSLQLHHIEYAALLVTVLILDGMRRWLFSRRESTTARRRRRLRADGCRKCYDVCLDGTLFRRLIRLLGICFPGILSPECGGVIVLTILLTIRTRLTLALSRIIGANGRALVEKNLKQLLFGVADVALYAFPATVTNVGIRYTISSIEWRFRERLQRALHEDYLRGRRLYDVATTNTIDNPGHRITNDVQIFSSELAALLPSILKPLMDIVIFSSALSEFGGYGVPLSMASYYALVAVVFRMILPNFVTLMANSHAKEGDLRTMHTQLIHHAEEVAFYRGADAERVNADRFLRSYIRLERQIKRLKWWSTLVSSLFVEYGSTCVGLAVCAFSVSRRKSSLDPAALTQLYMQNVKLCVSLSKSIARLLSLHLKLSAVCGGAHRLGELQDALQSLEQGEREAALRIVEEPAGDRITFSNADIVSPAGKTVLADYSATFKVGRNVLIMGCNGAGKTALVRIITGAWPLRGGSLMRLPLSRVVVLTQRVYLPPGTMRTQLTYPMSEADVSPGSSGDAKLVELATRVGLGGVLEREGGLDAWREWADVLSGGERQRVAFVRALYHKPAFVFLDECTSAVSQNIEPTLYRLLLDEGATLITISHRGSLMLFHDDVLVLDGGGGCSTSKIDKP